MLGTVAKINRAQDKRGEKEEFWKCLEARPVFSTAEEYIQAGA
ncbi:hypothetical protein GCM10010970_30220 [Silvimonas iriomotensis]|uniref:Uncharacterized protein n=1 Tax=Silvimonas iriomotensis TaxID=449662 RepID=A0ABQ2PBX1_9NEIS|nr:hypothetical protein GCM10010970_30220 [Silvimonas iriomotensis]